MPEAWALSDAGQQEGTALQGLRCLSSLGHVTLSAAGPGVCAWGLFTGHGAHDKHWPWSLGWVYSPRMCFTGLAPSFPPVSPVLPGSVTPGEERALCGNPALEDHEVAQSMRNPGPKKHSDQSKPQHPLMGLGARLSHGTRLVSAASPVFEGEVRSFQTIRSAGC